MRTHGGEYAYQSGCRCDPCRAAHAEMVAKVRANAQAKGLAPNAPQHGTNHGYVHYGCRCAPCREAHAVKSRRDYVVWRERMVKRGRRVAP